MTSFIRSTMRFLHLLMHHMGSGDIRVKVARLKEQA